MLIVSSILRLLLGLYFTFTGAVELSDSHIPVQVHAQMKAQMAELAEVLPLKALGYSTDPEDLLVIMSWAELLAGLLLVMGPPLLQELSAILLTLLMMGKIYNFLLMEVSVSTYTPSILCLGLLLLLVIGVC